MKSETSQGPDIHAVADLGRVQVDEGKPRGPLYRLVLQLQRRRVSRAALSYALIMWLNVQIGDVVFPMFGLPDWTLRLIVVIGFMGFPLIIFLAWTFQITPRGIVVDVGADDPAEEAPVRDVDMAINIAFLVLGLALATFLLAQFSFADSGETHTVLPERAVAAERHVLVTSVSFRSANDQPNGQAFVSGVEAEVRHILIQMENVTVISSAASTTERDDASNLYVLSGSLYLDQAQTHVLVHLLNVGRNEYVWTTAFDLSNDSVLEAEQATAARIVSEIEKLLDGSGTPTQLAEEPAVGSPAKRA